MNTRAPANPPAEDPESFEKDAKQLAKLTTNFYAALNELLPAAIRASKRGKHGLLRLISRKLPRPKLPQPEDAEDDRRQDDDAAAIAESVRAIFQNPKLTMPEPSKEKKEEEEKKEKREEIPQAKRKPTALKAPPPVESQPHRTSGAPQSFNEEPWPGQPNLPRPFHRCLKKRT